MKIYFNFFILCFLLLFQVAKSQEDLSTKKLVAQKEYPLYPVLLEEK